jgi:dephospho-CoA kinase
MKIGLTGGLGVGKSTVAALLEKRGARVIDADQLAREVVQPGTAGLEAVVARFGGRVVSPDGRLDRAALAEIVFADPVARADLNAIVHPLVRERARRLMAEAPEGALIVYDVPLLVENKLADDFDAVVVVEAPHQLRIARLIDRGLSEAQARARMASQATDEQRRAIANYVLVNDSSTEELAAKVDELWQKLGLAPASGVEQ